MNMEFHPTHHGACAYLSMLGFKLNQVNERGPWKVTGQCVAMGVPGYCEVYHGNWDDLLALANLTDREDAIFDNMMFKK